jgi:outer membrane murein-binding lipoprotein Lpp
LKISGQWESEASVLRSAVDELHSEVYTLHDEFESAHSTAVRRAADLILRQHTRAQERLDEAQILKKAVDSEYT